jgi:pilus assembly protein CpaB
MKPKTLVLLTVAVGCGFVAMLGIQQAMQGGQGGPAVPTVRVLVALKNIEPGVELREDNVGFKEMPTASAPADAVTSVDQYEKRALIFSVIEGDIIRQSKLGEKGQITQSNAIPAGMRAISIPVNDTHTLSGLLRPGDRVDLLVTYSIRQRGIMTTKTKTLLEYIEVFATDSRTVSASANTEGEQKVKIVSLLVTPEQVNYIKLAESKGSLALSWRNRLDDEEVALKDIDNKLLEELQGPLGINQGEPAYASGPGGPLLNDDGSLQEFLDGQPRPQQQVAVAAPRPTWKVQIYVGNEPKDTEFELPADAVTTDGGAVGGSGLTGAFRWLHKAITNEPSEGTNL